MARLAATLVAALVWAAINAASTHRSLDAADPIEFYGDSISYGGRTITLGPRAFFIDGSLVDSVANAHPYVFNSLREAAQKLTDGTAEQPMCVYLAPWVYWADDPDTPAVATGKGGREPIGLAIRCQNLHLVGLTRDARNVVIASQRGQTQGAIGNFTMLYLQGDGLQASNLTMGNFCNVDLSFPLKPELGRSKRSAAITQAHVAYVHGDRAVARNVRFVSRLNLNPMNGARRILYDRCHFECTDDALTGNGVYLNCTIDLYGQKPFYTTAKTGAVFLNCDFTVKNGNRNMVFCKQPGPLALIDCRYHAPDSTYVGWANYPEAWLRCYQAGFTLNGKPYRIGGRMAENTVCIDSLPAIRAFREIIGGDTLYNTFNLLGGNDNWDPQGCRTLMAAHGSKTGKPLPTCLLADRRKAVAHTGGEPIKIAARQATNCGEPLADSASMAAIRWVIEPGYERYAALTQNGQGGCTLTSLNDGDTTVTFCLLASTPAGLQAAVKVSAVPKSLPAPTLRTKPRLAMGDSLTLCYNFDTRGRKDRSRITWFRCRNVQGEGAIPVAVGRGDCPLRSYRLSKADEGWHIMARIEPAHVRSLTGKAATAITERPIGIGSTPKETCIETDFSQLPTAWQPQRLPGFWTVDGFKPHDTAPYPWTFDRDKDMWTYGRGFNGARGTGLLQAQRGARLLYTPATNGHGDMAVTLCVAPTKTAGQGFGSATWQYMDVYIKMDTRSMTGYALRIERTPKHAKAVDFRLMRYDNGTATPISAPVSATCYRTECTIRMEAKGRRLAAEVTTTAAAQTGTGLPNSVRIEADIEPNAYGGTGVQHTGSCGESTTMLHSMKIEYHE